MSLGNAVGDQDPGPSYSKTRSAISCTTNSDTTLQFTSLVLAETGDYTLRKTLTPTILSYAQMRESVRLLSSTETYRNSLKTANPVNYDVCEDCKNCDKEALIDASIAEVAGKNCQRILDTLEANWKKNPLGFDDFNNYLKVPANNKLICKYNYCINNIESTKFDTKLATIEDWTEVERRGWNRIELLLAADPYFRDTVFRDTMIEKMNSVGILNFEYNANGTNDEKTASKRNITGPIDNVTDPLNTTYFIDKYGRSSGTGYHFLYYDLKQKRVNNKITQKEYDSCLSRQRWSLYRQYYNEGKRKIKIEETAGCDSMQAELKKQDRLPRTEDEIIERASRQNSDSDRLIQAGMTVLAFKISCARGITPADSTAISQRLFNYFKSRPYNLLYVIDEKDYAIDPVTQKCKNSHLEAVRALLDKNYNCKLSDFAAKNPTECLRDTTIYYTSDPELVIRRPRHMSISLAEEESEDEDRERAMEETESGERGAGIRQAAGTEQSGTGTGQAGTGTGQAGTGTEQAGAGTGQSGAGTGQAGAGTGQAGAESEEEENTGVENAFLQAGTGAAQQLTPIAEVNALIALYNATQGNQWENTTKLWRSTRIGLMPPVTVDTDISNWYGVGLDDGGHLVSLNLFFNNLNGTLPGSLSVCTRLKVLNLGYNPNLTGHLQTFRNMPALEELNLSYDQFSGSLSSLSDCINLKELDLSETQLSGNLSGLAPCTKLKQIRLSGNQFTGSISLLGSKEELEEFYLVANRGAKLSGNLSIFKDCSKLRVLNLFGNELDGSLAELGSKSKPVLEVLDLYSNKLTGDLSGLSGYTNLKELTLSRNEFTGSINVLGQLTNLEKVLLSRNHFSGSLSGLLNCSRLRHLEIRDNEFTFTDLQRLSGHTFTGPFRYSPQAAVDTDQRIECRLGEPFTLTTDIDRSTTTPCTYQWFKKIGSGEPIPLNTESTAGHTCLFTPEIADKEAELYYIIKNENFRDLTLTSQKRKLRIAYTYCLKWSLHPEAPAAKLWDFDVKEQKRKCRAVQEAMAAGYVERMVDTYIDEKTSQLLIKRDSSCLKNAAETLDITYTNKEHHYTLYYYDQAGNLVQTVPPQGVQTAAAGNPPHTLKTTYRYNAQNQVVEQTTPDAGTSHFYYNKKGQLRFSQNAQQALESRYAYTKYNAQGRITETGEATQIDLEQMEESEYPQANRTDVTHTHYDAPARRSLLNQKYLRSRVSYTETIETPMKETFTQ